MLDPTSFKHFLIWMFLYILTQTHARKIHMYNNNHWYIITFCLMYYTYCKIRAWRWSTRPKHVAVTIELCVLIYFCKTNLLNRTLEYNIIFQILDTF
jgi:hypothetical protein